MIYHTLDEIRAIGKETFGDLYTYPDDQPPARGCEKIRIICSIHGEYTQVLNSHRAGNHCNKCSYELRGKERSKGIDLFIEEAKEIHGNKYDYSKFIYINCNTKSTLICNHCDLEFQIAGDYHINSKKRMSCLRVYRYKS